MSAVRIRGYRTDTRTALQATDGQPSDVQLTANGDLRVRDDDAVAAVQSRDLVLVGQKAVTIPATSDLLFGVGEIYGAALPTGTIAIVIRPDYGTADLIYFAATTAVVATSPQWEPNGNNGQPKPFTATTLGTLALISGTSGRGAGAAFTATVECYAPRN